MPAPVPPGIERRIASLLRRRVHRQRNDEVRAVVRLRAADACEYCLMPTNTRFHVDHIIPPNLWSAYMEGRLSGVPPLAERQGPNHLGGPASPTGCDA